MSEAEIKKLVSENKCFIGTQQTLKGLRNGTVSKVYVTSNAPETVQGDINHYAKIADVEVEVIDLSNEQLGDLCKKNFQISILSVKK